MMHASDLVILEELELLEKEIRVNRIQLIETGLKQGMNHKDTIKLSQQLDEYIIRYQTLKYHNILVNN